MTKKAWGLALAAVVGVAVLSFFIVRYVYTGNPSASEDPGQAPIAAQDRQMQPAKEQPDQQEAEIITGQMTLADIQRDSGIRATDIVKRLNLPPGVPTNESLGRLRQRYPFTMDQVRNIVAELSKGAGAPDSSKVVGQNGAPGLAAAPHETEAKLTRGRGEEDQSRILITGQMTLREIEMRSGVSARLIADRLGLPAHVPMDAQLGRLRKTYRFTMQEVRDIVSDLMKRARP